MKISLCKHITTELTEFETREWHLADLEHYGKAMDFTKHTYKFIAEEEGEIAGMIELITEHTIGYINGLLVGHTHRRKGVGAALMMQAESLAQEKGCTKIWLETNEGWDAVHFYQRMGYAITGRHEKHINGQTTLILTKFFQ